MRVKLVRVKELRFLFQEFSASVRACVRVYKIYKDEHDVGESVVLSCLVYIHICIWTFKESHKTRRESETVKTRSTDSPLTYLLLAHIEEEIKHLFLFLFLLVMFKKELYQLLFIIFFRTFSSLD